MSIRELLDDGSTTVTESWKKLKVSGIRFGNSQQIMSNYVFLETAPFAVAGVTETLILRYTRVGRSCTLNVHAEIAGPLKQSFFTVTPAAAEISINYPAGVFADTLLADINGLNPTTTTYSTVGGASRVIAAEGLNASIRLIYVPNGANANIPDNSLVRNFSISWVSN